MPELSEQAQRLLGLIPPNGRASNISRLRTESRLVASEFEPALEELVQAGLVVTLGRGGRIARAQSRRGPAATVDPPTNPSSLTPDARLVLDALPADGSSIGNYRLRSIVTLDNDAYAAAVESLRAARLVRAGPGRGGTLARATPDENTNRGPQPVWQENELYEPFVDWLNSIMISGFAHARVTATPLGRARESGRWSRPDVTAVQVERYEWLPNVTLTVSSYEIKRASDSLRLESIYEAAAHGRWAHEANLVIEDPGVLNDRFLDEIARFRLGLFVMHRRRDGGFDVEQRVEPSPQNPNPADANDLIEYFFEQAGTRLKAQYRAAIGR